MAANLNDLMLVAGVRDHPAWFSDIELLHWPMPHQMDMVKKYVRNNRYGDFSDPGAGKTFPAQIHAILMAALGNRVVITMPPKLIGQFHQEFLDFFKGIEKRLLIDHLNENPKKKAQKEEHWDATKWPDILLLSYDGYRQYNDKHPMKKIGNNLWKLSNGQPFFDAEGKPVVSGAQPFTKSGDKINRKGMAINHRQMMLREKDYNVLMFDEGHALCGMESIISKSVAEMSMRLKDDVAIYILTGTPIPTHLHDVYGILRLINPAAYLNKASFMRQHCIERSFRVPIGDGREATVKQIESYVNVERIYEHLWKNAHRVQKRDVIQLPAPIITEAKFQLSGAHRKLYRQVVNDRFAILGDQVLAPDNLSALRNLAQQLISCPTEFGFEGDTELDSHFDAQLESIAPNGERKVIVFAFFKKTIEKLSKRYAKYNPGVVNGVSADSDAEIQRFKTDPNCSMLIINWISGGAGLNLQAASYILFYENPTSPKDAKQAIARADRKGQLNIVNVYFFRALGTYSDKNFKLLLKNEESNNRAIKDRKDLLHELLG